MLAVLIKGILVMALQGGSFIPTHSDVMILLMFGVSSNLSVCVYQFLLNNQSEPIESACAEPEIILEE